MAKGNTKLVKLFSQHRKRKGFFNRKYKDCLFRYILSDKEVLLDLYNALNGTDYADVDDLEFNTLEDAVYLGYKNDLSFLIGNTINLYEHQSTPNNNMPLRGLLYVSALFENYVAQAGDNLYGNKLIELPMPQCIVFYNGQEQQPERQELHLSDSYQKTGEGRSSIFNREAPCLEFTATVLNINQGYNQDIVNQCRKLKEYMIFIGKSRYNQSKGMSMEEALDKAIEDCIRDNILRDILMKNRAAVKKSLLTQFDEKQYRASQRAEAVEEGIEQGIEQGIAREKERFVRILIEDFSKEGFSDELIVERLQQKYKLTLKEVAGFIDQYKSH